MDSYSRFDLYDFDSDAHFQEGLKKVCQRDLLQLKIFYYNRFVEPIDFIGFQEWCDKQQDLQTASDGEVRVSTDSSCAKDSFVQKSEEPDKEPESAQGSTLSFSEVFRMIQDGEDIPGLKKLDIKPCNQQPTASQMSRKLKPWEK